MSRRRRLAAVPPAALQEVAVIRLRRTWPEDEHGNIRIATSTHTEGSNVIRVQWSWIDPDPIVGCR